MSRNKEGKIGKFATHYSGDNSLKFWFAIATTEDTNLRRRAYRLQNLEWEILKTIKMLALKKKKKVKP